MTECIWTHPVARKRHRCQLCRRSILPGETYQRMAGLDRGYAWTYRCCDHCYRVSATWSRSGGDWEWDDDCILDWLEDVRPAVYAALRAGWRYPDGELLPLPFQPECIQCGCRVPDGVLWCPPCNRQRIVRIERGFAEIQAAFKAAS